MAELPIRETGLAVDALGQALPVPDLLFGGVSLVLVIMFHAFWIRLITHAFLKRSQWASGHALWRADLLFAASVLALLALHLGEVMLWSGALVMRGIIPDWSRAAYFAANCYTALGQPFSLPSNWRIVAPIIAMSGIFTFAWTASVLVNFVSRYNDLRASILGQAKNNRQSDRAALR